MTTEYGPDPDKSAYRFAINRQAQRWKTLRPQWVEAMGESAAEAVDAELARCLDPNTFDDALHAHTTTQLLTHHLDRLEAVLTGHASRLSPSVMLERARTNATHNAERRLAFDGVVPSPWKFLPLHAEVNERPGVIVNYREVDDRSMADFSIAGFNGRIKLHWKNHASFNGQRARLSLSPKEARIVFEFAGEFESLTSEFEPPSTELYAIEVTKQGGPKTALPGLQVRIPSELPKDISPEERRALEAQLAEARAAASTYDFSEDPRTAEEVAVQDVMQGQRMADATKDSIPYAAKWSDDPKNQPGKEAPEELQPPMPERIGQALKQLYEFAGLKVKSLTVTGSFVKLELMDGPAVTCPLPDPLAKLLKSK